MKNVAVLLMELRARAQGWADRPKEKPKNEENTDFMFFSKHLIVVPHAKLTPSVYPFPIKHHTTLDQNAEIEIRRTSTMRFDPFLLALSHVGRVGEVQWCKGPRRRLQV
jgi:hypothetical protein